MEPLLEVKDLNKHYDKFSLQSFNMTIAPGETVGLVGTNGAGKSTLIKCILGIALANSGTIRVFGEETPKGATAAQREDFGVVFDTCYYPSSFSLKDIESLVKHSYKNFDADAFHHYLDIFEIKDFKKVESLSRGMGMKLSLACAMSHSPKLLILDEATAGLDPMVRDEVIDVLRNYQLESECGILMCSHITSDLEKLSDRVICLDNGRTAFCVDRDQITDMAGIARCRQMDFDALAKIGFASDINQQGKGILRFERNPYGIDVLVRDRFAFSAEYPDIPCDRCSIEDYMRLMLKGETR